MAYLTLLYQMMAHNSAPMHFACLPLSMTLFMWQAHQNTQEPMGKSKRAVRMVKALLRKNEDPYPALLAYRSTPLQNGFSPSELLMGRRLRTKVPTMPSILKPNVQDTDRQRVQLREDEYKSKQQIYHDKRHPARALPSLTTGQQVWVRDQNREGQILGATKQPRSY